MASMRTCNLKLLHDRCLMTNRETGSNWTKHQNDMARFAILRGLRP